MSLKWKNSLCQARYSPPKWSLPYIMHKTQWISFWAFWQSRHEISNMENCLFYYFGALLAGDLELHALAYNSIQHKDDWYCVERYMRTDFRAKFEYLHKDPTVPRVYPIKALLPASHEDSIMCPVRALHIYLNRTKGRREKRSPSSSQFQFTIPETLRPTLFPPGWNRHYCRRMHHLVTLRRDEFLRQLYQIDDQERADFHKAAHEVRARSASYAFASRHLSDSHHELLLLRVLTQWSLGQTESTCYACNPKPFRAMKTPGLRSLLNRKNGKGKEGGGARTAIKDLPGVIPIICWRQKRGCCRSI